MGITPAATTTTTAVIHITEHLTTLDGRTTTAAIDLTSIISVITTATKAGTGWCEGNQLAWSNSKPAFFVSEAESFPLKPDAGAGGRDAARERPCPIRQITRQR